MTVGFCCSGASSQKHPRRLTPPGGSLQAGDHPIFPRQRIWLIAKIGLILSCCGGKVNPLLSSSEKRSAVYFPFRRPRGAFAASCANQPFPVVLACGTAQSLHGFVKFALKQSAFPCKCRPFCCTIRVAKEKRPQAPKNTESEGGIHGCFCQFFGCIEILPDR